MLISKEGLDAIKQYMYNHLINGITAAQFNKLIVPIEQSEPYMEPENDGPEQT